MRDFALKATAYIPADYLEDEGKLADSVAGKLYRLTGDTYEVTVKRRPALIDGRSILVLDGSLAER